MSQDNETDILGSREPANNGYGQNGFQGPSSDLPGKKTSSGFLPQTKLPDAQANGQTREVSAKQVVPNAHGQRPLNSAAKVPDKLSRK